MYTWSLGQRLRPRVPVIPYLCCYAKASVKRKKIGVLGRERREHVVGKIVKCKMNDDNDDTDNRSIFWKKKRKNWKKMFLLN